MRRSQSPLERRASIMVLEPVGAYNICNFMALVYFARAHQEKVENASSYSICSQLSQNNLSLHPTQMDGLALFNHTVLRHQLNHALSLCPLDPIQMSATENCAHKHTHSELVGRTHTDIFKAEQTVHSVAVRLKNLYLANWLKF